MDGPRDFPGRRNAGSRRRTRWGLVRHTAASLAAVLAAVSLILTIDTERSIALDFADGPTTSVLDHSISWARYPQREARVRTVDPVLVTQCRQSAFVVVTFSGTGMEESHYQANMIQGFIEDLGGCVMYHWYGHVYDARASARSVEKAIEEVTPKGRRKAVVFLGASFGGIAAEDVATEPVIQHSTVIDLRRIIMIATPVDMNDVIQDVFGIPVPLIKNIPVAIPRFGGLVVLGNAINGQRQRGQLSDPIEWKKTFINAAKTRPVLMWSELERIRKGMLKVRHNVPVDYLGSPDSETTVNTDQAYERVDNIIVARTRYIVVRGGGHDKGWLMSAADRYNEKLAPIFQELFGQEA